MRRFLPGAMLALSACPGAPPVTTGPTTNDSDTAEPHILPQDSFRVPMDTAPEVPPDLTPEHWVTLEQGGIWTLGQPAPPWESMTGTLRIREYVDELEPGATPDFECDVTYALTGDEQTSHSCNECDFVFQVEHYVTTGSPDGCHDPDVPGDGAIWTLGFDGGTQTIYRNYAGTGLWLPWYSATRNNTVVTFDWSAVLAIEVPDSGDM